MAPSNEQAELLLPRPRSPVTCLLVLSVPTTSVDDENHKKYKEMAADDMKRYEPKWKALPNPFDSTKRKY